MYPRPDVVAERDLLEILHGLLERDGVRDLEQEDHRYGVNVDLLDPLVEGAALLDIDLGLALDEVLLELGIAEAAAIRFEGGKISEIRGDLARVVDVVGP